MSSSYSDGEPEVNTILALRRPELDRAAMRAVPIPEKPALHGPRLRSDGVRKHAICASPEGCLFVNV